MLHQYLGCVSQLSGRRVERDSDVKYRVMVRESWCRGRSDMSTIGRQCEMRGFLKEYEQVYSCPSPSGAATAKDGECEYFLPSSVTKKAVFHAIVGQLEEPSRVKYS